MNVDGDVTLRLQVWPHTAMPLGTLPQKLQTLSKPFFLHAAFGHGILAQPQEGNEHTLNFTEPISPHPMC